MRETATGWGQISNSLIQSQSSSRATQCNWWARASLGRGANLFYTVVRSCQPVLVEIVSLCVQAKAHLCRHCHTQPLTSRTPAFVI